VSVLRWTVDTTTDSPLSRLADLSQDRLALVDARSDVLLAPLAIPCRPGSQDQPTSQDALDLVPNVFVSVCTSKLNISIQPTSSFHSFLHLIAALFIVGDRVFWTSNRAEENALDEETRLTILKAAFDIYFRDHEKVVTQVIMETFPSKPLGQIDRKLEERLILLIRAHCLAFPAAMQADSI